ncbi:MAG: hypothetical protein ABFD05_04530 [Anaerolineaceae bacterium]
MTTITIPAISTLRSAERGVGAGWVIFLRGAAVLVVTGFLEREAWGVFFLARLGVLFVVPDFFLLPVLFLVLLVAVLRAIAIRLTFLCSSNYSMRTLVSVMALLTLRDYFKNLL